MRATCLVALLVLAVSQASARETPRANEEKPDSKSWAGAYVYNETGMNVTGTRSFGRNYCIDVVEKGGALSAIKYEFESGGIPDKAEFWDARAADGDGKIEFTYKGCSIPGEKACKDELRSGTEMRLFA